MLSATAPLCGTYHDSSRLNTHRTGGAEYGEALRAKWFVKRPWYRKKRGPSFADTLATLRQASWVEASFHDPAEGPGSGKTTGERILQVHTWLSAAG